MTLCERIKLIDDMIRENPNVTIKDYLELVGEIREIENVNHIELPIIAYPDKTFRRRKPNRVNDKYFQQYRGIR